MRSGVVRRRLLPAALAAATCVALVQARAHAQAPTAAAPTAAAPAARGLLAAPRDYSLSPPAAGMAAGPAGLAPLAPSPFLDQAGGEASVGAGTGGMREAGLAFHSGVQPGSGLSTFVAAGAGRGPDLRLPGGRSGLSTRDVTAGVQKSFGDGTTVSLEAGWQNARLSPR